MRKMKKPITFMDMTGKGRCKDKGKVKYSKAEATDITLRSNRALKLSLNIYKCYHCNWHHITSQPQRG